MAILRVQEQIVSNALEECATTIFWIEDNVSFTHENGGSMFFPNVNIDLQDHMVSYPRKQ
jgi:hypothetical protein